jgi:GTP-binding protein
MNVFCVDAFYLLDLPGYGYARASKTDRLGFARLLQHVLARSRLAGVVWLLDIRREPSVDDRAMLDRFADARTPVLAAVTKSDKLSISHRVPRVRALGAALSLDDDQIVTTSARTREGIPELHDAVQGLVRAARS